VLSQDYAVTMACDVLGCARSSYYHRATDRPDEVELKAAIKTVAAEWPTYGYRRITAQLRRQEWRVNHKRVQRLMRLMDIQAKTKRKKRRTTNSEHDFPRYPNRVQDLEIVRPEQVWVSDITYVSLRYYFVYRSAELTAKPGCDYGCLHPWHSRMASGTEPGSHVDPDRTTASASQAPCTRDPPL